MKPKVVWTGSVVLAAALTFAACGGSNSSPPTSPTPPPGGGVTGSTTFTISGNAVTPRTLTVSLGSRITFVNTDNRPHDMNSNPHPEHTDCPALNVGFLAAGESRTGQNLTTVRTCGFHDHNQPDVAALQGTVVIVQ